MPTSIDDDSSKSYCIYCKDLLIFADDIILSYHLSCQLEIDNYLSPKDLFIKTYPNHRSISGGHYPSILLAKDGKLGFSPSDSFLLQPEFEQNVNSLFTYYANVETPKFVYLNQSRFILATINELIELIYQCKVKLFKRG